MQLFSFSRRILDRKTTKCTLNINRLPLINSKSVDFPSLRVYVESSKFWINRNTERHRSKLEKILPTMNSFFSREKNQQLQSLLEILMFFWNYSTARLYWKQCENRLHSDSHFLNSIQFESTNMNSIESPSEYPLIIIQIITLFTKKVASLFEIWNQHIWYHFRT